MEFTDILFYCNLFFLPEKPCPLQPKYLGLGLDIARKTPSEKYEAFGNTFINFSVKVVACRKDTLQASIVKVLFNYPL